MKLIITIGLPGSGKSTWAGSQNVPVICPDTFLMDKGVYKWSFERANRAWAVAYQELGSWLRQADADTVIFDACFCSVIDRAAVLNICKAFGVVVEAVFFHVDLKTCIRRNESRSADRHVPETRLLQMAGRITPPSYAEDFNSSVFFTSQEEL